MSVLRTVAGNTLLLSAAQIVNPLTSVLLVSAIARSAGVEGLGAYSLVLTIFYMAANLGALGMAKPIIRAVSRQREAAPDFLNVASGIGLVTGAIATAAMHVFVAQMGYGEDVAKCSRVIAWAVIPSVMILHFEAIFLGVQRAKHVAAIGIGENLAKVAIGSVLLLLEYDITALFALIASLRFAAFAAYLGFFIRSIGPIVYRFDMKIVGQLRRVSPVFTAGQLVGVVFGRIDVLILSWLGTMADLGYYTAALRLVEIARLVPVSYLRAVLPAMSEALAHARETCRRLFRSNGLYMGLYGLLATLGMVLLSGPVIAILYGSGFEETQTLLKILALLLLPASLAPVAAALLLAANLEFRDFLAQLAENLLLAVLSILCIPIWGGAGAAVARVSSTILFLALLGVMLRKGAATDSAVREVLEYGTGVSAKAQGSR